MTKLIFIISLFLNIVIGKTAKCNEDNKCGEDSPCCSEHGYCGSDLKFCNIGCDPLGSNSDSSCMKPAKCESKAYKFDEKRISTRDDYDGDFEKYDFIITGDYDLKDGKLILKLNKDKGSKVMLTRYAKFATISAKMKSGHSKGVISSFITMSDVKDEIDFEWVGSNTNEIQTNFYYRGVLDHKNGNKTITPIDTHKEFQDYTIDWQSDGIDWKVGNSTIRKMNNKEKLPNTPSRIELGIWNGGSGAEGTKEWAGGEVNFGEAERKDSKGNGYFTIEIESLSVKCNGNFDSSSIEDVRGFEENRKKRSLEKTKSGKAGKKGNGVGLFQNNDLFGHASHVSYSLSLVLIAGLALF